jgi:hypothetical protein
LHTAWLHTLGPGRNYSTYQRKMDFNSSIEGSRV